MVAHVRELVDECAHDRVGAAPAVAVTVTGAAHLDERLTVDAKFAQTVTTGQTQPRFAYKGHGDAAAFQHGAQFYQHQAQDSTMVVRRGWRREKGGDVVIELDGEQWLQCQTGSVTLAGGGTYSSSSGSGSATV